MMLLINKKGMKIFLPCKVSNENQFFHYKNNVQWINSLKPLTQRSMI